MIITKEYLDNLMQNGRNMLKPKWELWNKKKTEEGKGVQCPELVKPYNENDKTIDLMGEECREISSQSLTNIIATRKSHRKFSQTKLTLKELSYLLWDTSRVIKYNGTWSRRPIPSAGGRHCLETYVFINSVEGIDEGLYRYHPIDNKLIYINSSKTLKNKIDKGIFNQLYDSAVTFFWTALPYRMEYRYSVVSHKMIAIEAGHACQNLYLASEAIGCGCCAISAYDQNKIDKALQLDGEEEFVIYVAIVGKKVK